MSKEKPPAPKLMAEGLRPVKSTLNPTLEQKGVRPPTSGMSPKTTTPKPPKK